MHGFYESVNILGREFRRRRTLGLGQPDALCTSRSTVPSDMARLSTFKAQPVSRVGLFSLCSCGQASSVQVVEQGGSCAYRVQQKGEKNLSMWRKEQGAY